MSLRRFVKAICNPGIFVGIILAAVLVALAYQVRPGYDIQFGTPTDGTILDGFHAGERVPANVDLGYKTFRWMKGYGTVTFRDVGAQPFTATLMVNGSRPEGQPAPRLTVRAAGHTLLEVQPPPGASSYSFGVPADILAGGSFTLELTTNAFRVLRDPRELGIIVTRLQVRPAVPAPTLIRPSGEVLVSIIASAALLGLLSSLLGWGSGAVAAGGALPGLLGAGLLAFDRLWLTSGGWYGSWPGVLLLGAVLMGLAWWVGGWLLRVGGALWTDLERRVVLSLFLAAFAFRLGGQLHPQIFVYDLGFHLNRLHLVEAGQLLFTTQPAEFGGFGHSTFYLPTPYLFVIPLNWLLGDERMAVRVLTVLLGSLGTLPVFYLARKVLGDGRAGLLAAALYVCLPMAVLPYSWGITSNVFGEFFTLMALAVAVGNADSLHPRRPAFWGLSVLLLMALLSHPGVVAVTGAGFVLMSALRLIFQRHRQTMQVAWTLASLSLAGLVAFAVYYNHFVGQMLDSLRQIGSEKAAVGGGSDFRRVVGGSVEDATLGLIHQEVHSRRDWIFGGIEGVWREAVAYYRVWPLLGAVLGLLLVWPARRFASGVWTDGRRRLALACAAWLLVVLLFALVGWATNVYVRYMLSALPIVALGTGILLSSYWRRGWGGRWLSALVVVFFSVQAVVLWHYRINYLFK